jgi:hypothetical protein
MVYKRWILYVLGVIIFKGIVWVEDKGLLWLCNGVYMGCKF